MSRVQMKATETGLLISERFSDATLKYIQAWDPPLFKVVMKARKQKGVKE